MGMRKALHMATSTLRTRSTNAALLAGATIIALWVTTVAANNPRGLAQEAERTERVVVAVDGDEGNLNPFRIRFGVRDAHDFYHLVYDNLYSSSYTNEPVPWLAESAEPNEDLSTWTVRLHDGVKWHDGEDLTADDVAFSYELVNEFDPSRYGHHLSASPKFSRAEVVDDLTVRLHFEHPVISFEQLPAGDIPILPKHVWEQYDDPFEFTEELPVGSGPYELVEMVPDERYVMRANPDYFMGEPAVDELVFVIVPDPSAAFSALQAGDVDHVDRLVPPELLDGLEGQDDIEVVGIQTYQDLLMRFNHERDPLTNRGFRRALALGIDRQRLVDQVLRGHGRPGRDTYTHPDSYMAAREDDTRFDPDAARDLLDEAGYEEGPDGFRTMNGEEIVLELIVNANAPIEIRAGQLLQEDLEALGIRLDSRAMDAVALRQARGEGDYDLRVQEFSAHHHTDPNVFFAHSMPYPEAREVNPELADLMDQSAAASDPAERLELINAQQQLIAEEAGMIALLYYDEFMAYRPEVYDGWVAPEGHGLLTKFSFVPGTSATGTPDGGEEPDDAEADDPDDAEADDPNGAAPADDPVEAADTTGMQWWWVALLLVGVLGGGTWFVVGRRREDDME